MNDNQKIYVAGSNGMVGSSIIRALEEEDQIRILKPSHSELDLTKQVEVKKFLESEKPDQVYLAAAKVGGIHANNTYPAEFIYQNLMIQTNIIHQSWAAGVKRLLFLGSSCIYPQQAKQPIKENYLLSNTLEPTNEPYAIAKIAGIKLCESYNRQYGDSHGIDFRSIMPTNLYGPGDNYHPENSHVIPGLIRRFHDSKEEGKNKVEVWGSGKPRREFLFVDDLASASTYVMNLERDVYQKNTSPMSSHLNVGVGFDISIEELSIMIAKVVGYKGSISFDTSKPDGTPQKLLDSSKISLLGWKPSVDLESGLKKAYENFILNRDKMRD